ncbi:MAG: ACP S-malonyltransferase [Patescibacteria group bacterium]|nr:ACP S-malonyltransferase [Patescibacteria group bacterium]
MGRGTEKEPELENEPQSKKIAFAFPGQGSQYKGMGRDFYDNSPVGREVFDIASNISGFSLPKLCFDGEVGKYSLEKTEDAQLAIATVCIAGLRVVEEQYPKLKPNIYCGVSFGELSMLPAAGVVDFKTLLLLIRDRGKIMEEVGGNLGKMIAVFGLERDIVEEVCKANEVYPAIYYSGMTVVSGKHADLKKATAALKEKKGLIKDTGVNYPFHSPLMEKAREKFKDMLAPIELADPSSPVALSVTGKITESGEELKEHLPDSLTSPVDTHKLIEVLTPLGIGLFVEFCPKPTLSGFIQRRARDVNADIQVTSIHDLKSLSALSVVAENCVKNAPH